MRVSMLTEVLGLTVEREVVEFREGGADGTQVVRSSPGRTKSGEVTVVRGLTTEPTFEQWMRDVTADADAGRRTVAILVLDRKGQRVATFTLTRAWPRKAGMPACARVPRSP